MTRSSMSLCGGWGRLSEELRVYTGPNVKDHSYEDLNPVDTYFLARNCINISMDDITMV